ncbi:Aldo/keto reductase [Alternaria alternata]|nr:Aldo/keto reductase [Alternaria alternata]
MRCPKGSGRDRNTQEREDVVLLTIQQLSNQGTHARDKQGCNIDILDDVIACNEVAQRCGCVAAKSPSSTSTFASKCGIACLDGESGVTNSPSHIKKYIDGTIERLGFTPDLYYLHRIDPNTPLEESIPALDECRKSGKTKYIGLSECSAKTLRKANSKYSAFETLHETDGLIDTARQLNVAYVAYSPLGHGWLVDNFDYSSPDDFAPDDFRRSVPKFQGENFYKNKAIVEEIKKLAKKKGCTTPQIALAWVAAQGMIAIPGTTKAKRLEENWASRDVELTDEERKEMRKIVDQAKPAGNRYAPAQQAMVGH